MGFTYWDDIITIETWEESEQIKTKEEDKFLCRLLQSLINIDENKRKEKLKKFINKNVKIFKGLD